MQLISKNVQRALRHIFICMLLFQLGCISSTTTPSDPINDKAYPRLAMWWPNTWEQPLDELKRYDWIGFGSWDNMTTVAELKKVNPSQKHFMDYSITETAWSWWQGKKTIMEKIPSEWFLTQRGTVLVQSLDTQQTVVSVEAVVGHDGKPLFEINDAITCEFETMKVVDIYASSNTLSVERGFIRSATSHVAGTRIAAHITFWPTTWVMNMSTMCPEIDINDGDGPQRWVDFASNNFSPKDEWDGYIVDRIENSQSWLIPRYCRNIDPDCSNDIINDNYNAFDAAWYAGCEQFLESLHSVYANKAIISNTSGAYYQTLNGAIYESFPGNWNNSPETYQDWARRALGENGYINVSKSGYQPNYSLTETYEDEEGPIGDLSYDNPFDHPGFVPNYQRMRYGLTTALLGDGYFSYEINTNGHGSLGLMWFDEYDNAGLKRGYLGMPKANARELMQVGDGSVWIREYEKGIIICNPANDGVTVDLEGSYRLIQGTQVPEINTGALVSEITLQPRDGRILLKD